MVCLSKFIYILTLIQLIKPIFSQQSYDRSDCTSEPQIPGSNYLCNSKKSPCDTFIVYRAQKGHQTLHSISSLFNTNISQLISFNNMSDTNAYNLKHGPEIIVPVTCSCPDRFSQALFGYNASHSESLFSVACEVFEGLVKAQILIDANQKFNGDKLGKSLIEVPVRCACPEASDSSNGTNFLVTYPIVEHDSIDLIARKFGVTEEMIRDANNLEPFASIIPHTTLLIPTKIAPVLNLDVVSPPEDAFSPRTAIPLRKIVPGAKLNYKNLYLILGGSVFVATVVMSLACGVLVFIRRRYHHRSFQPLSARSSQLTDFPHDFLDDMSKLKHSLISFTLEELMFATSDFCEASVIGKAVYRGKIGDSYVAIEQMNSMEAAHHVIDILTMINHLNVVKLVGFCSETRPCLVYEFAENGSLRDCLSNSKKAKQLTWARRMQIAFDLAEGLHYIHYSTKPAYVHRNISSRNLILTVDWRAKISGFRLAKPMICSEEKGDTAWIESVIVGRKGYLAPEYLTYGQASLKVDIYAFGIVLIELLSAKEAITDGRFLKDSISFIADGGFEESSECLRSLKGFMDPNLEGDYPLGDAMCLALLAKACVEDDPLHRPTMNDVLRALSRIL